MSQTPVDDDDEDVGPPWVLRVLQRWRALLVLVPLAAGLGVAAVIGARMLWAEMPERERPGPDVTCWDGSTAPAVDCPSPGGVAGLRWVFPSFTPGRSDCARVVIDEPGPFEWSCQERLDGEPVRITYGVRDSAEQALARLRARYTTEPERAGNGERRVFRLDERTEQGYVLAVAYARHPYVVTVSAATIGLRDRALEELVTFRREAQLAVRPG